MIYEENIEWMKFILKLVDYYKISKNVDICKFTLKIIFNWIHLLSIFTDCWQLWPRFCLRLSTLIYLVVSRWGLLITALPSLALTFVWLLLWWCTRCIGSWTSSFFILRLVLQTFELIDSFRYEWMRERLFRWQSLLWLPLNTFLQKTREWLIMRWIKNYLHQ